MTSESALHLYTEGSLEPGTVRPDADELRPDRKARPQARKAKRDDKPRQELEAYLKEISQKFETGARPGKFARFRVWTENELFWRGQQLLTYNPAYGRWDSWSDDEK